MSRGDHDLPKRLAVNLVALGAPAAGDGVLVALSGGIDSLVLLHLLRFAPGLPELELRAAHYDHGMRAGSERDASWVAGLARAWGVPLHSGAAPSPPSSENAARELRYAFLEKTRVATGADWVLTAHHADDQAETVLFRILRGTGIRGLAGIPARRDPCLVRPLLPFWKRDLQAYGRWAGIVPRIDPTNADPRFARNYLRHVVIPDLEGTLGPGVRSSLVELAQRARDDERAWAHLLDDLLDGLDAVVDATRISVALAGLARYDSSVQARVLREMARRLGGRLNAATTRAALVFAHHADSGRALPTGGGLVLSREFDRLALTKADADTRAEDTCLELPAPEAGAGDVLVGGRPYRAEWTPGNGLSARWVARFDPDALDFPLRLRGWQAGDRIRMSYGSKKLKKLFSEARLPVPERHRRVVLADRAGRVLWVPGVARAAWGHASEKGSAFVVGITHADDA